MKKLNVRFKVKTNYTAKEFVEVLRKQLSLAWATYEDCTMMKVSKIKVTREGQDDGNGSA